MDKKTLKSGNCKNGLTLIELIISMAIISIIAVAFFGVFGGGLKSIYDAGHRSKAQHSARQVVENILASGVAPSPLPANTFVDFTVIPDFKIDFPGAVDIIIPGKRADVKYEDAKRRVDFSTFLPD